MNFFAASIQDFFRRHPALLYGLSSLVGVAYALSNNIFLLLPITMIYVLLILNKNLRRPVFLGTVVILLMVSWVHFYYHFPSPKVDEKGVAEIEICSVASMTTHFGKKWIYKGTIKQFNPDNKHSENSFICNIPCSVSLPQTKNAPRHAATGVYKLYGRLKEVGSKRYTLILSKKAEWKPIKHSWGLAEHRFWAKDYVNKYIMKKIKDEKSAHFLSGIATGDFDDRELAHDFGRFGLQHIMAISGFHFAIFAMTLSLIFRCVLSYMWTTRILILILTSYFIFLGGSPSIIRAWTMAIIALLGLLIERKEAAFNSLGIALMLILIVDPFAVQSIGFQFSFAVTAAILLIYPLMEYLCRSLFIKLPLSEVVELSRLEQHAYCLVAFLRNSIALMLAVNLVSLPLTLFYFNKFPILSLLLNLFFPLLVSLSIGLLLLSVLSDLIYSGDLIHLINEKYTKTILSITQDIPLNLDLFVRVNSISLEQIVLYLTVIFLFSIVLKGYLDKKLEEWAFSFV